MTKTLLIAGTRSGCGKTSVTLGLLAALSRRGHRVAPFKTGPDFIDPGLHELACARISQNLDSWMLPEASNLDIFSRYASGADVAVIEGAMGLFDGAGGSDEQGSAAHMAKLLSVPVLLVLDAAGMGRSAAAMAQGYTRFDPSLAVAGVVLNRVGSVRHGAILREALDAAGIAVLGCLQRDSRLSAPSRHLGLHTAHDLSQRPGWIDALADWVEAGMDIDGLLERLPVHDFAPGEAQTGARKAGLSPVFGEEPLEPGHASAGNAGGGDPPPKRSASNVPVVPGRNPRMPDEQARKGTASPGVNPAARELRLGVARDRAFSFCYHENLRLLEAAGARLVFFSPLDDCRLPKGLSGLYLPGGYPELYASRLSANARMLRDIRDFSLSGRPVLAECGGFMALMDSIRDLEGRIHPMAGVFACQARMGERFAALGYREVRLTADTPLGPAGTTARGHEFHYSCLMGETGAPAVYALSGRDAPIASREGFLSGNTLGSYVHLHFASNPVMPSCFVRAMAEYEEPARTNEAASDGDSGRAAHGVDDPARPLTGGDRP